MISMTRRIQSEIIEIAIGRMTNYDIIADIVVLPRLFKSQPTIVFAKRGVYVDRTRHDKCDTV